MGMFDVVKVKIECPFCGVIHEDWQTKDLERLLSKFDIVDKLPIKEGTLNFYTYCPHRIHRDHSTGISLHIPVYRNVYIVWLEVWAPIKRYRIVRDVRRWTMVARPQKGHHLSVASQEVKVRKFNFGKEEG